KVMVTLKKLATLCNTQGVDLGQVQPGDKPAGNVKFGNCGDQVLTWTASSDQPWLSIDSKGQLNPQSSGTIHVVADTARLPVGTSTANVTITSNGGNQTVKVTVTVQQPALQCRAA